MLFLYSVLIYEGYCSFDILYNMQMWYDPISSNSYTKEYQSLCLFL